MHYLIKLRAKLFSKAGRPRIASQIFFFPLLVQLSLLLSFPHSAASAALVTPARRAQREDSNHSKARQSLLRNFPPSEFQEAPSHAVVLDEAETLVDDHLLSPEFDSLSLRLDLAHFSLSEKVRALKLFRGSPGPDAPVFERQTLALALQKLREGRLSQGDVDQLLQAAPLLARSGTLKSEWTRLSKLIDLTYVTWARHYHSTANALFVAPNVSQVHDLYFSSPNVPLYREGIYDQKPRLFMFCRHSRVFPCLMVMKNGKGQPVGWSQPRLALSKYGKRFDESNGYTPSGIYQVEGVMPEANDPIDFGKFRRLVLNFIEPSLEIGPFHNELNFQLLLPPSHWGLSWWRESIIARELGRNSFRLHGTGQRNENADSPYYPFVPTSGCIAARENTYPEGTYVDQRELLDELMSATDLEPTSSHEMDIMALLYVIEINDLQAPVSLNDLQRYGIH